MFAAQRLPYMVPKSTPVYVYGCKDDVPVNKFRRRACRACRDGGGRGRRAIASDSGLT